MKQVLPLALLVPAASAMTVQWSSVPLSDFAAATDTLTPRGGVTVFDGKGVTAAFSPVSPTFVVEDQDVFADLSVSDSATVSVSTADEDVVTIRTELVEEIHRLKFDCVASGPKRTNVNVEVASSTETTKFSFIKQCQGPGMFLGDVMMYTVRGEPMVVRGSTMPSFNIFNTQSRNFLVGASESFSRFSLFTTGRHYNMDNAKLVAKEIDAKSFETIFRDDPFLKDQVSGNATSMATYGLENQSAHPVLAPQIMDPPSNVFLKSLSDKGFFSDSSAEFNIQALESVRDGYQIEVAYNCIRTGAVAMELILPLSYAGDDMNTDEAPGREDLRVSWFKLCKVSTVKDMNLGGIHVSLGAVVPDESAFFAVRNGLATPAFSSSKPLIEVDAQEVSTRFYAMRDKRVVEMDKESKQPTKLFLTNVTVSSADLTSSISSCGTSMSESGICGVPVVGVRMHEDSNIHVEVTEHSVPFEVVYSCNRPGLARVTARVYFGSTPTKPEFGAEYSWKKWCKGTPRSAVSMKTMNPNWFLSEIHHESTGSTNLRTSEPATNAKTYEKATREGFFSSIPVVEKGAKVSPFLLHHEDFVLQDFQHSLVLGVAVSKFFEHSDTELIAPVEFGRPVVTSNGNGVAVSAEFVHANNTLISDQAFEGYTRDDSSRRAQTATSEKPVFLKVQHRCLVGGKTKVNLVLPMKGSEPFEISWFKDCGWTGTQGVSVNLAGVISAMSFFFATLLMGVVMLRLHLKHKNQLKGYMKIPIKTSATHM